MGQRMSRLLTRIILGSGRQPPVPVCGEFVTRPYIFQG